MSFIFALLSATAGIAGVAALTYALYLQYWVKSEDNESLSSIVGFAAMAAVLFSVAALFDGQLIVLFVLGSLVVVYTVTKKLESRAKKSAGTY